jgi:hypothetical protein
MKNKLWKLAKMLIQFKEYITEQGKIVVSGELVEGTEVAIENENGELVPVSDGEYKLDDVIVVVVDGKVTEIKQEEVEPEIVEQPVVEEPLAEEPVEEPTQEPEPDEKDIRIEELEGLLKDRDAVIEELTAKIKELEQQLDKPVEEPIKMGKTIKENEAPKSGALKYFAN